MKLFPILLLLLLSAVCSTPPNNGGQSSFAGQKEGQLKLDLPNWEPGFLEEIKQRSQRAGISDLRSVRLLKDDLEVRMWVGFATDPLKGFVIKRSDGQWSATYLMPIDPKSPRHNHQQKLSEPTSGWEAFWDRLTNKGILTLPDSTKLGEEVIFPDAEYYVVEVNTGEMYRAYKYAVPEYQKWPEAKRMAEIIEIIFSEFGIKR
ncbi:MAG: hypothetical protein ACRD9R_17030 [Pyrinomonadaceae bacterium]